MVDFKRRLASKVADRPIHPTDIYDRLDRASDKGPLRPVQKTVLESWHGDWRHRRDVILKLHTGEGKTLIGLLILQSKLNELTDPGGRALYLCPNKFLVNQTLGQARQFGVSCVAVDSDGELPADFLDGKAILVAPVQKLFNGFTKFGLHTASKQVDALVIDDAHACIDAIKDACVITLERAHPAYDQMLSLFGTDLEDQGVGTYADLRERDATAFLPVPYWAWQDHHRDVAAILAKHSDSNAIAFAWPLLRNSLQDCLCLISGKELVIAPYRPALEQFGSYDQARHRVFMSATISDDSFLVRGLALPPEIVGAPLTCNDTTWSGEKMVLIPPAIDDRLTASEVVHFFARPRPKSNVGTVALVPSFDASERWKTEGAIVAKASDIDDRVERLRAGERGETLVIVNRYDGVDLPDDACRVLVLDGRPYGTSLLDRFIEERRPRSEVISTRVARVIEQGIGRAVRGEKDYCVVVLNGPDLVRLVRTQEGRAHFSPQTRTQIEIGLEIAEFARDEIPVDGDETDAVKALRGLVLQSMRRDEGWKDFYTERMNTLTSAPTPPRLLEIFALELTAERLYEEKNIDAAVATLQRLLDEHQPMESADRGWYLQEIARYRYATDRAESLRLQTAAHRHNRYLLKPTGAVHVSKLEPIAQARGERILAWVRQQRDHQALMVAVDDIVGTLRFGTRAEPFERAIHELGSILGFASERPDKEWKAGPDNLWALRSGEYLLLECKSEVEVTRAEINKHETGQMNNASAWFAREYPGASVTRVLIIPPRKIGSGAGFTNDTLLLREKKLARLSRNVRALFAEFRALDLRDVSEAKVQALLQAHHLTTVDLQSAYYDKPLDP